MPRRRTRSIASFFCAVAVAVPAFADIVVPGADGSDGPFLPGASVMIDLSLAPTGTWDGPNTRPGRGVYDPDKWAVVFRYSEVFIPAGVTVTFKNHPSGAPVIWLVSENVEIIGTISLDGDPAQWQQSTIAKPGPGGYWGGRQEVDVFGNGAGAGPGGGRRMSVGGAGGSYGTLGHFSGANNQSTMYGNTALRPLIGGSGGAGSSYWGAAGGAGGGAILVACQANMIVSGTLSADGGAASIYDTQGRAGGSGGAIRLVTDSLSLAGTGALSAKRGNAFLFGGEGRIRIEANSATVSGSITPAASTDILGPVAQLWPEANAPTCRVINVDGTPVPLDPRPRSNGLTDISVDLLNPVFVDIETRNVPINWNVVVRVVPVSGPDVLATATRVSGDVTQATWRATVIVPVGVSAVQARASRP